MWLVDLNPQKLVDIYTASLAPLLQFRVLLLGLLQDGDVGIGVFPEGEEVLVGSAGFRVEPGQGLPRLQPLSSVLVVGAARHLQWQHSQYRRLSVPEL